MNDISAFPHEIPLVNRYSPGMSLRDFFAAAALTGLMRFDAIEGRLYSEVAECAYRTADAMLDERERKP